MFFFSFFLWAKTWQTSRNDEIFCQSLFVSALFADPDQECRNVADPTDLDPKH